MTTEPDAFDHVVFDAEPLVAYFVDGPGADLVERYLLAVEDGDLEGYVHDLTRSEVLYVCARTSDPETARNYLDTLVENGMRTDLSGDIWATAGAYKFDHPIALGDAYALASATSVAEQSGDESVGLLVGAHDDFDPFEGGTGEVRIVRTRHRSE